MAKDLASDLARQMFVLIVAAALIAAVLTVAGPGFGAPLPTTVSAPVDSGRCDKLPRGHRCT